MTDVIGLLVVKLARSDWEDIKLMIKRYMRRSWVNAWWLRMGVVKGIEWGLRLRGGD